MVLKSLLIFFVSLASLFSQSYNRSMFMTDWATFSGCINVREQVLIRDAKATIVYGQLNGKNCSIVSSTWICPYTGKVVTDPLKLDVDHMVPLKWAFDHGAKNWSAQKKNQYANFLTDVTHLVAVDSSANSQKSDKGPDRWLPTEGKCAYIRKFDAIVKKWELVYTPTEQKAMGDLLKTYCFP